MLGWISGHIDIDAAFRLDYDLTLSIHVNKCQMANKDVFILIKDQQAVNRKIEDKPYKLLRLIVPLIGQKYFGIKSMGLTIKFYLKSFERCTLPLTNN